MASIGWYLGYLNEKLGVAGRSYSCTSGPQVGVVCILGALNSKALRTQMFRCSDPKTVLRRAFGLVLLW